MIRQYKLIDAGDLAVMTCSRRDLYGILINIAVGSEIHILIVLVP